jgi:hypothetical protein
MSERVFFDKYSTTAYRLLVSSEQISEGWVYQFGTATTQMDFRILQSFSDGTYAVINPEWILEHPGKFGLPRV